MNGERGVVSCVHSTVYHVQTDGEIKGAIGGRAIITSIVLYYINSHVCILAQHDCKLMEK